MPLPSQLADADAYKQYSKSVADHLYRNRRYELKKSSLLSEYAKPGESERDFRIRLADEAREEAREEASKERNEW